MIEKDSSDFEVILGCREVQRSGSGFEMTGIDVRVVFDKDGDDIRAAGPDCVV